MPLPRARCRASDGVTRVIGYVRVSTRDQAESGAGLLGQRRSIADEAERRGWHVAWIEDAGESGKDLRRPGIREALAILKRGEASALVVAKLDRLSRSVIDFNATLELSRRQGWALICLDIGVDTGTPSGELVANMVAAVALWERRVIAARTRDALAERKAAGVRLGRARVVSDSVVARIVAESLAGRAVASIARGLDRDQIPTPSGGTVWHASTVTRIIAAEYRLRNTG